MKHISYRFPLDEAVMSVFFPALLETVLQKYGKTLPGNHRLSPGAEHTRVAPSAFLRLVDESIAESQLEGLGFEFGRELSLPAAGLLGQLFQSAKNLDQALQYLLQYYPLLSMSAQFELTRQTEHTVVQVERLYRKSDAEHVKQFVTESFFYSILHNARLLSDEPVVYSRLELQYDAPPYAEKYKEYFGGEVLFSCPENRVFCDNKALELAIKTASEPVCAILEQQAAKQLQHLRSKFSIHEQIFTILLEEQPRIPSQEMIAARLQLSQSSLYRRLKEANTSFRTIVDDFRRQHAVELLNQSSLSIVEVAEQLGFSDPSNFRRAFKKWTGNTPAEFRRAQAGDAEAPRTELH